MRLPFSAEAFFNVFREYNTDFWPAQFIFYALAAMILFYAAKKYGDATKVISGILAFFWIWMGLVYHIIYFAPVNKAAFVFGALFILQGLIIAYMGLVKENLSFGISKNRYSIAGILLIFFSLFVYPLTGWMMGHLYPASPTFGLPCPTTIFTFGLFLLAEKKLPLTVYIIPVAWALVGFSAAFVLGIKEDISLPAAALLFIIMNSMRGRTGPSPKRNIR